MATNPFYRSVGGSGGGGAYGGIPAPIGIPPNIFAETAGVLPNLEELTRRAGGVVGSELAGQLSPETLAAIQDQGAAWGVQSGMPGSGLAQNRSLRNLGLNVEALQHQGIGDLLATLTGVGSTMTKPDLAAEIADRNSIMAAAPNPAAAAAEQQRIWEQRFNLTRGSGGNSLTWYDLTHPGGAGGGGTSRMGTGKANFLGGFEPGAGGAPQVGPFMATGPFSETPTSKPNYTLTGSTVGGGPGGTAKQPFDEILDALFNPADYTWNPPGGTLAAE